MSYGSAMKSAKDAAKTAEEAEEAATNSYQQLMATALSQLADAVAELARTDD